MLDEDLHGSHGHKAHDASHGHHGGKDLGHGGDHGHGHHDLTPEELNWRCRLFLTLEEPDYSLAARLFSAFINACLFMSIIAFMMGTMPEFKHFPYVCPPHMIVGYTCWDGYGMPTKVMPVDVYHKGSYLEGKKMYDEYLEKKKEKEAAAGGTKGGYGGAGGGGGGYAPAGAGVASGGGDYAGAGGGPAAVGGYAPGAGGGAGYPPAGGAPGGAGGAGAGYTPGTGGAARGGYPPAGGAAGAGGAAAGGASYTGGGGAGGYPTSGAGGGATTGGYAGAGSPDGGGAGGYAPAGGAGAAGGGGYAGAPTGGAGGGGGYPSAGTGAGYPSAGGAGGYPPSGGGYSPAGGYQPAAGGFPPATGGYAPMGYGGASTGSYPPRALSDLLGDTEEEPSWMSEVAPTTPGVGLFNLNGLVQPEVEVGHRRLAYKKKRPIGEPYCEEICEYEPDKEIEIAEGFAMAAFTIDYLGRLFTAHAVPWRVLNHGAAHDPSAKHYEPNGLFKTVAYFFSFMMLVDLLALGPYYAKTILDRIATDVASSQTMRALGIVRVLRIIPFYMHMIVSTKGLLLQDKAPHIFHLFNFSVLFNFLRLGSYTEGAPLFFSTLKACIPAISVAVIAMVCLAMVFASLIFVVERGRFRVTPEYPDGAFLTATSQRDPTLVEPAHANSFMSMWYVISDTTTMPTIAMLTPVTILGEVFDVMLDYMSLLVLTLPIAIVAREFNEQYTSFFKDWNREDIIMSSSSEDEGHSGGLDDGEVDDFDAAVAKLAAAQEKGAKHRSTRFSFDEESKIGEFRV